MKKTTPFLSRPLFFAAVFWMAQLALASEPVPTKEVPYKLVEGKQYEICNALLPFINTMPHGTLREQPELLEKVKDFRLPDWQQVTDKKYIDLSIKAAKLISSKEYADERYQENYVKISGFINSGGLKFYISRVDIDNTGDARPVMRRESWVNSRRVGGYYTYFAYDEKSMEPEQQYSINSMGELIFFKRRTFTMSEGWIAGDFKAWKLLVAEPRYVESWPSEFPPHSTLICTFVAK